jgi:uncharacterized protein
MLQKIAFILWVVWAATTGASWAQEAPLMGSEASPASLVTGPQSETEDGVYRILVIGDALAGGLGAGMTRMSQDDAKIEVINRFNESSGLARREVYDWAAALPKIVADKPVNAVVVLVGMNDRQSIRDGNFRHVFRAPDWVKAYEANIDQLIAATKTLNAQLFWISLPPMANSAFDADMRLLSGLHSARVAEKGGRYVDVRPFFVAADGSYIDKGPDEAGVERKLRARDGITFFKQGNNRFGQLVLKAMQADIQRVPTPVASAPAVVVQTPGIVAETIPVEPPSFGQTGLDGEDIVLRADAVTVAAEGNVTAAKSGNAASVNTGFIPIAKQGTWSQRLLTMGIVEKAPLGRFDDFSVPAVQ